MKLHGILQLGWLGVVMLMVACTSPSPHALANAPTATAQAARPAVPPTQTPAPTETTVPTMTPGSTQACREEHGRLDKLSLDSRTLARRVAYYIYLPPCYDTDQARVYPVLYLLHGAHADYTQWPDLNVAPDADTLIAQDSIAPFVVVMPDGDYRPGEDYAAFMLYDLMPHIEQTTRVARDRQGRAIGGLSQGGYWALEIALTHPDLFGAAGGHSPATDSALTGLLALTPTLSTLRIYLDAGRDDPLASSVAAFAAALQARGLKPTFHLYSGGHNRIYWRAHTVEYLAFYSAGW